MGIKLIALLKAKPGMSREDLKRRWVDEHAGFVTKYKNLKGYRINVATDEFQQIEGELPFDGTAELWWDSIEEMKEDFAAPEAEAAVADAHKFAAELIHIFTTEYIAK